MEKPAIVRKINSAAYRIVDQCKGVRFERSRSLLVDLLRANVIVEDDLADVTMDHVQQLAGVRV